MAYVFSRVPFDMGYPKESEEMKRTIINRGNKKLGEQFGFDGEGKIYRLKNGKLAKIINDDKLTYEKKDSPISRLAL